MLVSLAFFYTPLTAFSKRLNLYPVGATSSAGFPFAAKAGLKHNPIIQRAAAPFKQEAVH